MRMSCKATSRRCASQRNGSIVLGASILEAKDHIRERLGSSPDLGDAAALTFAVDLSTAKITPDFSVSPQPPPGGWMAA